MQGTVNGIGERVGNTDLLTVIADLELKMGAECVGHRSLVQLTGVAQYVAELCNVSMPAHHPYTALRPSPTRRLARSANRAVPRRLRAREPRRRGQHEPHSGE